MINLCAYTWGNLVDEQKSISTYLKSHMISKGSKSTFVTNNFNILQINLITMLKMNYIDNVCPIFSDCEEFAE